MIETGRDKISFWWLLILSIPVATFAFVEKCSGTALTFTIKKFVSDPALIVLLGSLNSIFAVLIAPWAALKSDTISTFLGRRKNFIAAGFLLLVISLVMVPYASNMVLLVVIIILYQFAVDFGYTGPWRPLYFDIVPKKQRGRGMVVNRYASIAARFVFMYFLIGSFDMSIGQNKILKGMTADRFAGITGEKVIYISAAALVLLSLVLILFFVKEKKDIRPAREHFRLVDYLREMYATRDNFYMCLLVICYVLMSTRLTNLRPLLITEQFGYSKKTMGNINVITMLFNTTLFLPLIAIFIDRLNYFRVFVTGMIFSTLHPAVYWIYVKFFAEGGIPSIPVITVFNIADSIFDRTAMLVLWPFLFDMVNPAKKGFMNSGFLIITGIVGFVNTNLMGLWVKASSALFYAGKVDYMNCYIYIFVMGILGCAGTYLFSLHLNSMQCNIVRK